MPYTSGRELDREQLADSLEDLAEGIRENGVGIISADQKVTTAKDEYTHTDLKLEFSTDEKYRHLHNTLQFTESEFEPLDDE